MVQIMLCHFQFVLRYWVVTLDEESPVGVCYGPNCVSKQFEFLQPPAWVELCTYQVPPRWYLRLSSASEIVDDSRNAMSCD